MDLAIEIIQNDSFNAKVITKYNNVKKIARVKVTDNKNLVLTKLTKPDDFDKFQNFF